MSAQADGNDVHLSKRFFTATEWATARHAAAPDADPTTRPSIGQVLGIASLVLEDGGTEREAIAAMLLDAIGADEAPVAELRAKFGKKTARLVAACAEARAGDDLQERIHRLEDDENPSLRRVFAADLLRELRRARPRPASGRKHRVRTIQHAAEPAARQLPRAAAGADAQRSARLTHPGAAGDVRGDAATRRARYRDGCMARRARRRRLRPRRRKPSGTWHADRRRAPVSVPRNPVRSVQMTFTSRASSPLRPGPTSNSTRWPSSRDL